MSQSVCVPEETLRIERHRNFLEDEGSSSLLQQSGIRWGKEREGVGDFRQQQSGYPNTIVVAEEADLVTSLAVALIIIFLVHQYA